MNVGVILAAGQGRRFGGEVPKQFVEVLGKPILGYTLEAFQSSPDIDAIEIVCQPEERDRVIKLVGDCEIDKLRWITNGGRTCSESVRNAIFALRDSLDDGDNVVLHTGVSPLVTLEDISAAVAMCAEKGCCFTMHPVRVCMAQGGGEDWADTDAPKERYVELNGPWAFRYGEVYDLYRRWVDGGHALSETDYTLRLWLADGRKAWYVRGSEAGRMKITTPHDRELFEGYLRLRRGREAGYV